jgi:hypothetical protein
MVAASGATLTETEFITALAQTVAKVYTHLEDGPPQPGPPAEGDPQPAPSTQTDPPQSAPTLDLITLIEELADIVGQSDVALAAVPEGDPAGKNRAAAITTLHAGLTAALAISDVPRLLRSQARDVLGRVPIV